jgi:hypothetical protein
MGLRHHGVSTYTAPLTDLNPVIRQLEATNRRLYTRELLKEAAVALAKAQPAVSGPVDESQPSSTQENEDGKVEVVRAPDLDGNLYKVWPVDYGYTRRLIQNGQRVYVHCRELWHPMLHWRTWCGITESPKGPLFKMLPYPNPMAGIVSPEKVDKARDLAQKLEGKWQHVSNSTRTYFEDIVRSQFDFQSKGRKSVRIGNIICFALGTMNTEDIDDKTQANRLEQHVFACCLAKWLQSEYSKNDPGIAAPSIPIHAFDPDYTGFDHALLSRLDPPITVLFDPHCFLRVTENSLILSIGIPRPAANLSIIADLLWQSGGPAALLQNTILEEEGNNEGFVTVLDVCTPPVLEMLKGFEETKLEQWKRKDEEKDPHAPWWVLAAWWKHVTDLSLYTRKPRTLGD